MKVKIRKKFLLELSKLSIGIRKDIEQFVFEEFPANPSLKYWKNVRSLKQNSNLVKILFDEYRIALKLENDAFIFERIRHRDDIYRINS
ncbi:hypothetical protein KJ966_23695 [bacterium]|nr:hypothetical protein [bacterium]